MVRIVGVVVGCLLIAGGCTDGGGGANASDTVELERAVGERVASAGDRDALAMTSARCAAALADPSPDDIGPEIGPLTAEVFASEVSGATATVDYTFSDPYFQPVRGERWAHEGGAWKWDDC